MSHGGLRGREKLAVSEERKGRERVRKMVKEYGLTEVESKGKESKGVGWGKEEGDKEK